MKVESIANNLDLEVLATPYNPDHKCSVFYFTLEANDSLCTDPFNQLVQLSPLDKVNFYSITLPLHGQGIPNLETVDHWRAHCLDGMDPLPTFLEKTYDLICELEEQKRLSKNSTLLAGLSRGAFVAAQLCDMDKQFPGFIALAPMTRLFSTKESNTLQASGSYQKHWELLPFASSLYSKKMFISMGNRDDKVGTEHCIELVLELLKQAKDNGLKRNSLSFQLYPSVGHKGHGTPPEVFLSAAQWLKDNFTT